MAFGKKTVEQKVVPAAAPVVERKPTQAPAGPSVLELLGRVEALESAAAAKDAEIAAAKAALEPMRAALQEILDRECKSLPGETHGHRCGGPAWHAQVRAALS